jgi:hypothetical protein
MNIKRHHNTVQIAQFLAFMAYMIGFFLSVAWLKEKALSLPLFFLLGPALSMLVIRLLLIFYLPPPCTLKGCGGALALHLLRNRHYACLSCGKKTRLKKFIDDPSNKKAVKLLLGGLALMIVALLIIVGAGILRNAG